MKSHWFLVFILFAICLLQSCEKSESFSNSFILQGGLELVERLFDVVGFYNTAIKDEQCQKKEKENVETIYTSSDIRFLESKLKNYLDNSSTYSILHDLHDTAVTIDNLFASHIVLQTDFNKSEKLLQNSTYRIHVKRIFQANSIGIDGILYKVRQNVAPTYENLSSLENIEFPKLEDFDLSCKSMISPMQLLDMLLSNLILLEYKGLTMIQFAEDLQDWFHNGNNIGKRIYDCAKSSNRHAAIVGKFKHLIASASNVIETCKPEQNDKRKLYVSLSNIRLDLEDDSLQTFINNCQEICSTYIKKGPINYCPMTNDWLLRNCKTVSICNYPLGSSRELDNISPQNSSNNDHLCLTDTFKLVGYNKKHRECAYCNCKCHYQHMYKISLDDSFANVKNGYVVTGARLVVKNNIIRIQLQQGKLLQYGAIDPKSVDWIALPPKPIITGKFSTTFRLIEAEPHIMPENYVVIGMKFDIVHYSQDNMIHIGLHTYYKKFDFTTGIISDEEPVNRFRTTIIERDDVPNFQYVVVNENTIIDIQNVTTIFPSPLSGAGLVKKTVSINDGKTMLGLNLYIYNITTHLNDTYPNPKIRM